MRKHKLQTYKRIHRFDHAVDVETGKIRREISTYVRQGRKAEKLTDRLLQDPADEDLAEELASSERRALKEHRNARVHKKRLSDLEEQGL